MNSGKRNEQENLGENEAGVNYSTHSCLLPNKILYTCCDKLMLKAFFEKYLNRKCLSELISLTPTSLQMLFECMDHCYVNFKSILESDYNFKKELADMNELTH